MGYFRKNPPWLRIYFFEPAPVIFPFSTLPLEIPDKTNLNPWMFPKLF